MWRQRIWGSYRWFGLTRLDDRGSQQDISKARHKLQAIQATCGIGYLVQAGDIVRVFSGSYPHGDQVSEGNKRSSCQMGMCADGSFMGISWQ